MKKIGLIGLGEMGKNLAELLLDTGNEVVVFNRSFEKTEMLLKKRTDSGLSGAKTLEEFVHLLPKPRTIILIIQAGTATDELLTSLLSLIDPEDIIIDLGNSHFEDTSRREKMLNEKGIYFLGVGISGGVEGARKGPSLMAGGNINAWKSIEETFEHISAKNKKGKPACHYFGTGGAGHFVKMLHNGIEYAHLDFLRVIYLYLKKSGKTYEEIFEIFSAMQKESPSYLLKLSCELLEKTENEKHILDIIEDRAESKGTGIWISELAQKMTIPLPIINAAIDARAFSHRKEIRNTSTVILADARIPGITAPIDSDFNNILRSATLLSYMEGFQLLFEVKKEQNWDFSLQDVLHVWEAGSILASKILEDLSDNVSGINSFEEVLLRINVILNKAERSEESTISTHNDVEQIHRKHFLNESAKHTIHTDLRSFADAQDDGTMSLRNLVQKLISFSIAPGSLGASLTFHDHMMESRDGSELIQGLRDGFGSHGFTRTDKPGHFHWKNL